MKTLDEAWQWYEHSVETNRFARRIASRHWAQMPETVRVDEALKNLSSEDFVSRANVSMSLLDDLAVLVLFSVFEDAVRSRVRADMRLETATIKHPLLSKAAEQADDDADKGSFFRVLQAFKTVDTELVEEVNQVRDYRNWVAHGRRGEPRNRVAPRLAWERLQRFLEAMDVV